MSQRNSGYARREREAYDTPPWVLDLLLRHWQPVGAIWEPAAGAGNLLPGLRAASGGCAVIASDIEPRADGVHERDFFRDNTPGMCLCAGFRTIVTNPPYGRLLEPFARRACEVMRPVGGRVALLTPVGWPTTAGRADLVSTEAGLSHIIHVTPRIRWIEGSTGAPSADHHWLCWDFDPDRTPATQVIIGEREAAA